MRSFMAVAVALSWVAPAFGQERWRESSAEVRPFAGVFLPVGAHRSDVKSTTMLGVQEAVESNRHAAPRTRATISASRSGWRTI
jgi:hypothetical protein